MRVLVHTIFYRPEMVGVAKYIGEMCQWLDAHGHQVEVVCAPPYYPQWAIQAPYRQWRYGSESLDGVAITRCPIWLPRRPGGWQRIFYSLSFAASSVPALVKKLFRRPDAVFVVEPSFLNAIPALLLARLTGALAWMHIMDFEIDLAFDLGQLRRPWLRRTLLQFESWVMRRFDVVSTISRSMQAKVLQKGVAAERSVFFPCWVDVNAVYPLDSPSPLRAELGISENTVVALFSGTLGAKQGIEILISAAREVQGTGILFVICGDGPAAPRLRALAEGLDNVRFLPLQPAERINDLLNAADIHLLPQMPEAADSVLPSKLLNMLASGRPVVATVKPESEVGRLVARCGILTEPGDARQLADAVSVLAANRYLRMRLGSEARSLARLSLRHDLVLGEFENALMDRRAHRPSLPPAHEHSRTV